jgi:4-azaleucine resistance transporter AzlC
MNFNIHYKALKESFPYTIPVFTGFVFLGIAYGILMNSKGFDVLFITLFSLLAYAGSAQFIVIGLFALNVDPIYVFILTFIVNARHIFYGISMLKRFKNCGKLKYYLIFAMSDESFSIIHTAKIKKNINEKLFMFYVTFLNHIYWVIGSLIGAIIGTLITFNTQGLDFILTALFIVILLNSWENIENRKPAIIGIISAIVCLILFGVENYMVIAMISIVLLLSFFKNNIIEKKGIGYNL